jgi:hypothetical protein
MGCDVEPSLAYSGLLRVEFMAEENGRLRGRRINVLGRARLEKLSNPLVALPIRHEPVPTIELPSGPSLELLQKPLPELLPALPLLTACQATGPGLKLQTSV